MSKKDNNVAGRPDAGRKTMRTNLLLSGILILVAGIVLLICNKTIKPGGIVTVGGILFLLAGIINVVLFLNKRDEDTEKSSGSGFGRVLGAVVSLASAFLGITMLIFQDTFARLVAPLFGILLILGVLVQLYIIMIGSRPVRLPGWSYGFPGLLVVLALIIFMSDLADDKLMIVTGVGLVIFGMAGFIESFMVGAGLRAMNAERGQQPDKPKVVDVDAKDVKEIKPLDD